MDALQAMLDQLVTKDGIKPLGEDIAGIEMALIVFAMVHHDKPTLRAGLMRVTESLKPEYRETRSVRFIFRLIAAIDQTSPQNEGKPN